MVDIITVALQTEELNSNEIVSGNQIRDTFKTSIFQKVFDKVTDFKNRMVW